MKIDQFEDIIAWQKSRDLTVTLYQIFKDNRDFGFKDQIQRASVSIMNNIAEGFERGSDADFRRFLFIAKASCGEVRSMLYLAKEFKYVTDSEYSHLSNNAIEISKAISGFIKVLS
ncbi:MAG: four helix bundle protein [Candidatus Marinimicrobia bacterium]|jgi:four helix bundle protein|nr:four helix bundle protein [Candidatus Neomarinimicrobiota bacterium]